MAPRRRGEAAPPPPPGGMISQLFILAPNGHTIVNKDYRGDVPKDSAEIFLRRLVDKSEGEAPIFNVDGVNYLCVRKNGLFFLATTLHNVPPAYIIELLTQLTKERAAAAARRRPPPVAAAAHRLTLDAPLARRRCCWRYTRTSTWTSSWACASGCRSDSASRGPYCSQ